ncbi:MAG: HEAT repeat domain-containing protein [Flavobacteriales bacterium]|nr:MAG: HEAT repeat domain-containing protein [Flavobacteriales bacterium]
MNDPLKNFIDHHRDDLDDLEPSPAIFAKIKSELEGSKPKLERKVTKLTVGRKWLVAASVLVLFFTGYLILNQNDNKQIINNNVVLINKKHVDKLESEIKSKPIHKESMEFVAAIYKSEVKTKSTPDKRNIAFETVYKDLQDSSSSSTRLAAILEIGQSGMVSYDTIDKLAKTLEADNNSNVRLAALNLLGRYSEDSYVNNVLMKGLETQSDPISQLGLIDLLGRTNHPKLEDRLYALANDPNTVEPVKDQAYLVLLNQNKL